MKQDRIVGIRMFYYISYKSKGFDLFGGYSIKLRYSAQIYYIFGTLNQNMIGWTKSSVYDIDNYFLELRKE